MRPRRLEATDGSRRPLVVGRRYGRTAVTHRRGWPRAFDHTLRERDGRHRAGAAQRAARRERRLRLRRLRRLLLRRCAGLRALSRLLRLSPRRGLGLPSRPLRETRSIRRQGSAGERATVKAAQAQCERCGRACLLALLLSSRVLRARPRHQLGSRELTPRGPTGRWRGSRRQPDAASRAVDWRRRQRVGRRCRLRRRRWCRRARQARRVRRPLLLVVLLAYLHLREERRSADKQPHVVRAARARLVLARAGEERRVDRLQLLALLLQLRHAGLCYAQLLLRKVGAPARHLGGLRSGGAHNRGR